MAFKIYTKTGDSGSTGLFGGKRLPKSDIRIEAYGTVDELNAFVGLVRDDCADEHIRGVLETVQNRLFTIGSNLASDPDKQTKVPDLLESDIELLEKEIDQMNEVLPPLKNFILPGGHRQVSQCHIARCVCRRAERSVVRLSEGEEVAPVLIKYLNRLSDYLFVLSRKLGHDLGAPEIAWHPRS
ncbi:MAG: cob(I)yrinic acid a,c-diamide adenosyltransferase [Bacteroidetes bacterium]|nr:MAG: cob(I)yrinic acid a,c-diamide adenosyltransferase [Bacteroidota bacterium]